jgi:hypothetical protein
MISIPSAWKAIHRALEDFRQDPEWLACMQLAESKNRWFDQASIAFALDQWREMSSESNAEDWIQRYGNPSPNEQRLGLILAGNLPLVGIHDVLTGVLCGYRVLAKASSDDAELPKMLLKKAAQFDPIWSEQVQWVETLKELNVAIVTGSNQTARHFAHFFRDIPHLIRHHRSSVAVLSGNETPDELLALGRDVFHYYGLGCRSVSKLYVPEGYSFETLLPVWEPVFNVLALHNKYVNNYHYHKALLLMNLDPHIDSGYAILKEREQLHAPVGMLNYEFYTSLADLSRELESLSGEIQCIATNIPDLDGAVALGQTQCPGLFDYADGVDTVEWLLQLS